MTTVLVRNMQGGPTVFSTSPNGGAVVEWKGAGDIMGEDLQPVSDAILEHVEFQRAVSRGIFSIESAPEEIERAFSLHRQEWSDRQSRQQQASAAVMDQQPQNDMLMLECIAPQANGTVCGTQVPVRQKIRYDQPTLCGLHKTMAPQFVSEITDQIIEGKPVVNWVMPKIDQLTRQQ